MKGFTLLEILVSMAILVIIMGAVYSAYTSNAEVIQQVRHESDVWQKVRIVMDRMAKDMESSFIGLGAAVTGESREIDGRPADSLRFSAVTHLAFDRQPLSTDLCMIEYYLKEIEGSEMPALYRKEEVVVAWRVYMAPREEEMADGIAGLEFAFQDKNGIEYETWDSSGREPEDVLPALIRIKLRIRDESGREHTFATSVHPGLAEPGAREVFGSRPGPQGPGPGQATESRLDQATESGLDRQETANDGDDDQ